MSNNHLTDLLVALAEARVKFIICGGVAAVLHGVERMTLDLDITIDMEPENISRFIGILKTTQLEPRIPVPPEALLDPEKIRVLIEEKNARVFTFFDSEKPWRQVDVFLTSDFSYNLILVDTVTMKIAGHPMLVVNRERLIKMKTSISAPREKDILDIKALTRLCGGTT